MVLKNDKVIFCLKICSNAGCIISFPTVVHYSGGNRIKRLRTKFDTIHSVWFPASC